MKTIEKNEIDLNELETTFKSALMTRETVSQFGQKINNPNLVVDNLSIDTLSLLGDFYNECSRCYDLTGFDMYSEEILDFMEEIEQDEKNHHNTYNWSSPLSNILDFKVFSDDYNKAYLVVNVQDGYSDARCGYLLQFMFEFDINTEFDALCMISEFENSRGYYSVETTKGEFISFDYDMFSEGGCFNVYSDELDIDECDKYIGDECDIKEYCINELKVELK